MRFSPQENTKFSNRFADFKNSVEKPLRARFETI